MKSFIKFINDITLVQLFVCIWDLFICIMIFIFTQNENKVDKYLRKRGYEN